MAKDHQNHRKHRSRSSSSTVDFSNPLKMIPTALLIASNSPARSCCLDPKSEALSRKLRPSRPNTYGPPPEYRSCPPGLHQDLHDLHVLHDLPLRRSDFSAMFTIMALWPRPKRRRGRVPMHALLCGAAAWDSRRRRRRSMARVVHRGVAAHADLAAMHPAAAAIAGLGRGCSSGSCKSSHGDEEEEATANRAARRLSEMLRKWLRTHK